MLYNILCSKFSKLPFLMFSYCELVLSIYTQYTEGELRLKQEQLKVEYWH